MSQILVKCVVELADAHVADRHQHRPSPLTNHMHGSPACPFRRSRSPDACAHLLALGRYVLRAHQPTIRAMDSSSPTAQETPLITASTSGAIVGIILVCIPYSLPTLTSRDFCSLSYGIAAMASVMLMTLGYVSW